MPKNRQPLLRNFLIDRAKCYSGIPNRGSDVAAADTNVAQVSVQNSAILYNRKSIILPEVCALDSVKRRGANSKRTSEQLQFIIHCMQIGEDNKGNKMSPSFASFNYLYCYCAY